jgi:5-methylcytosine-specific restriction endonuclease McrA
MSFYCNTCGVHTKSKKNLNIHFSSVRHKLREQNKHNEKQYVCFCGKVFTQASNLYRHRKKCNLQPVSNIIEPEQSIQVLKEENNKMREEIDVLRKQVESLEKKVDNLIDKKIGNINISQKRYKIPPELRIKIKEEQNNTCGMCKKEIIDIFELDHITALQFGGTNEVGNLMALCCECHRYKSNQETKYRQDIRLYIQNIIPKRSFTK